MSTPLWIIRSNQWYDALEKTNPVLRFSLFTVPLTVVYGIDVLLMIFDIYSGNMLVYLYMVVMAIWRFSYFLTNKH